MPRFELLFTEDFVRAKEEIETRGGRVTQIFSQSAFEAMMPERPDAASAPKSGDLSSLKYSATTPGFPLDETSELFTRAWRQLRSSQSSASTDTVQSGAPKESLFPFALAGARLARPFLQLIRRAPKQLFSAFREQVSVPATSETMTGLVAHKLIFVNGPASNGLRFSDNERTDAIAQFVAGTSFLASEAADHNARLSFKGSYVEYHIDAPPVPSCGSIDNCEAVWRNPLMAMLKTLGIDSISDWVKLIKSTEKSNWAYIVFIHKYPSPVVAVTQGDYVAVKYDAATHWTTPSLAKVFAHETCHIFGAADEYGQCRCGPNSVSGFYKVRNGNCVNCPTHRQACMMDLSSELNLCEWTRGQIGWNYWEEASISEKIPSLIDISVPPNYTDIYVVDNKNVIWKYGYGEGGWLNFSLKSFAPPLVKISAAQKGEDLYLWGLGPDGRPYRYNSQSLRWDAQDAELNFSHISVANDGAVWVTDPSSYILRYSGSGTRRSNWDLIDGRFNGVSVGIVNGARIVWAIGLNGKVGRYVNGSWVWDIDGNMSSINLFADIGWGTSGGKVCRYSSKSKCWKEVQGQRNFGDFKKISNGGRDRLYALTESGKLLRRVAHFSDDD
jgi:hypothetical protein